MPNTLRPGGRHGWRHRRREDKARRSRADRIADHLVGRNIPTDDAEAFRQGSLDDVDAVHNTVAFGNPSASLAIETDGMNFVQIGKRAISIGQIADLANWGDVSVHGIKRLERYDLGATAFRLLEQRFEMVGIIMPENPFLGATGANPGDHRSVVLFIREDKTVREQTTDRAERRLIGHIPRAKGEPGFLAVQLGKLRLERYDRKAVAGDIQGSTGAGADSQRGLDHRIDNSWVASHTQIVVGAPDDNFAAPAVFVPSGIGWTVCVAFEISKNSVAFFISNSVEEPMKMSARSHDGFLSHSPGHIAPLPARVA